jgi:hypothetical protein
MSQRPGVLIELGVELDRAAREAGRRRRIRVPAAPLPSLSGVATFLAVGCTLAVAGFAIIALDAQAAHARVLLHEPRRSQDQPQGGHPTTPASRLGEPSGTWRSVG